MKVQFEPWVITHGSNDSGGNIFGEISSLQAFFQCVQTEYDGKKSGNINDDHDQYLLVLYIGCCL